MIAKIGKIRGKSRHFEATKHRPFDEDLWIFIKHILKISKLNYYKDKFTNAKKPSKHGNTVYSGEGPGVTYNHAWSVFD